MDTFQKILQIEISKQEKLLQEQTTILASAPSGFLFIRNRNNKETVYRQHKEKVGRFWKTTQTNISNNPSMQDELIKKKLAEKLSISCQNNLPLLRSLQNNYLSTNQDDIMKKIPSKYDELLKARQANELEAWFHAPYQRCPYYPEHLSHRTAYGDYVRSKSEVVIANALYAYGIPFHLEEALFFTDYGEEPYYPDFTIRLPNHKFLYWEHWGLLSKEKYCRDNVNKLFVYQKNNLIVGKNLILTQDDSSGNCHSHIVYDIIEKMILPHFEGITLPRRAL